MPRYLLLLHGDEPPRIGSPTTKALDRRGAPGADPASSRRPGSSSPRRRSRTRRGAKVVRRRGVTDGPFAETKEVVGGFYLLECADDDEAVEWAKRMPTGPSLAVEVRPVAQV